MLCLRYDPRYPLCSIWEIKVTGGGGATGSPPRTLTPEKQRRADEAKAKREAERRRNQLEQQRLNEEHARKTEAKRQRIEAAARKREIAKQHNEAKRAAAESRRKEQRRKMQREATRRPSRVPVAKKKEKPVSPRECAMMRRSWAGGPRIRYTPPASKRPTIKRLRHTHRVWVGSESRQAACTASTTTAGDKISTILCPRKGWKWTGEPYRELKCTKCTNKPSWGWNCTSTVEVRCTAPTIGAVEIEMRRRLIKDLLAHALPKLTDMFDEWLKVKSGMNTAIPGGGFLQLGVSLGAAKRAAKEVERKTAQLTSNSKATLVKAVDRAIADLDRAVAVVSRQMTNCR